MKKRFLTILMSMLMVFVMMPVVTGPAYAADYSLWVGGVEVNSDNASDIPGVDSGKASYNAETNKLTLDGATITKGYSGRNIQSAIPGLTIEVKGKNSLTDGSMGIDSSENYTITGDGSLQAEGSDRGINSLGSVTIDGPTVTATGGSVDGIKAYSVTIKSGTVSATGRNHGINSNTSLRIEGSSKVHAEGTHSDAIWAEEGISIDDGLVITEPVQGGVSYDRQTIKDQYGISATSVTIVPSEYPLWVGGTQVTTDNCTDIPAAEGSKTGKASYDPFKNILTLDGYKYTGPGYDDQAGIIAGVYSKLADELTIDLVGENKVIVEEATYALNHDGIYFENDLVIKGSGSLDVEPGSGSGNSTCCGIYFSKGLTIGGDCTVNVTSASGSARISKAITGGTKSHLTIKDHCTVNAAGGDTSGTDDTVSFGIDVWNDIEITGGKVVATGGKAQYSYGIWNVRVNSTTKIAPADNSAIEVEVSGETQVINGNVINTIGGAGWTDTGGAAEAIAISDSGQTLNYKKVRFPEFYRIKAAADPEDGGTVTGGGTYAPGADVTLEAKAKDGYKFANWTENGEEVKDGSGQAAGANYTFDSTKDRDLKANFRIPLTITAKAQTRLYDGQEYKAACTDPDEIDAKVEVEGLKDGDKLAQIELFSEKKDVGVQEKCIEAKSAKIMRGEGDAAVDVTGHYEITYVKGDMTIVGSEVQVKKTLDGRDWTDADSFEFTLSPVNGAPMPDGTTGDKITLTKADKDADFTKGFGFIPFTQPGTYKYTVTETHKGETIKGVSYDSNDKTVTFEIKGDSKGNVIADGSTLLQTAEFTNTYNANGEVRLKASKAVSGADWPEGAEATFTLSAPDGAPMPDNTSVTLTAPGDAEFGPISYDLSDAGKTYTYTISETGTKGFDDWFTDKESVSVAVTVGTDNGDGTLSDAAVTYTPENTEITNTPVQWKFIDFTWTGDATTGYTEAAANYESTNTAGRTKTVKADISEKVTDPTCTEDGKTEYTATVSKENSPDGEARSESRDARPTSKTGHSLTKTDEVAASCTKAGTKAYWTCSDCDKMFSDEKGEHEITEPDVIKATGHSLTKTDEVAATCDKDGKKAYWTCSACKKMFSDEKGEHEITEPEIIKATGHSLTKTDEVAATCEKDGTKAYWTCSACNKLFSDVKGEHEITEPEIIKATGHSLTKTDEVAATCDKDGTKAYWTCSECKKMFSDEKGEHEITEPEVINVTGHSLTKTDEIAATCEKDGTKAYWTCSECKKLFSDVKGEHEITEPEVIKATGHDWGEWKVTRDPEAGKAGERQRVCKNDPSHIEKEAIPAPEPKPAPKKTVSGTLLAKLTAKGDRSLELTWSKIDGADGYDILFIKCRGKEAKKVKTIKGNETFKWTKKGLKKNTSYKACVKAWVMKGGKKTYVRSSLNVHAYTSGGTKNYTNAKSVTVKKAKVSLKAGKRYKIKAKVNRLQSGKKLMPSVHAPTLRYVSSNKKIATVSKTGTIKAKAKGSCKIYVIAVNGVRKTIRLTVR